MSYKDDSSGELAVEASPSISLDLLDTTLQLVIGGDDGIIESPNIDSVRSCTGANCPCATGGKVSTLVGLGSCGRDEEID